MPRRRRSVHLPLDHGNPADQRLSSYRMSMLAHGFKESDAAGRHEFVPDESGPWTYAVVALRKGWSVALVVAVIAVVLTILLVLLFA